MIFPQGIWITHFRWIRCWRWKKKKTMNYFLCLLVWFLKCLAEYNNGIDNGTKWFIKAKDTENIR